jgi:hypothetical protein
MSEFDSAPPTERLLAVTLATHDAFTEAARVVAGRGHAAEFARRAEYQGRIATHLRGHEVREGLASDALRHVPDVWSDWSTSRAAKEGDPRALFDNCLRLMDAATLEFCRGYGPNVALILSGAMRAANPINTTRHGKCTSGGKESVSETSAKDMERPI